MAAQWKTFWDWKTVTLELDNGTATLKWACQDKNYEWSTDYANFEYFLMQIKVVEEDRDLPEMNITR